MSPKPTEYELARSSHSIDNDSANDPKADETVCFTVDDKPYYPFLKVDPSQEHTIMNAVSLLLLGTKEEERNTKLYQISKVSGGITNALFRVQVMSDNKPIDVLVRVFGAEGMIDRDVENSLYAALATQKLAPPYYGRFANGRIEQFYPHSKALEVSQLSDMEISTQIAKQMSKLHGEFQIPFALQQNQPTLQTPSLFIQLDDWMEQAQKSIFQTPEDTTRVEQGMVPLTKLADEIVWLKQNVISADECTNKVGFCHNDLLAANILYDSSNHKLQLIDFEYGGLNYCAFDIANHFNEFAGGTDDAKPNYALFPSPEFQTQFCQTYLEETSDKVTDGDTQDLVRNVQGFVLVNHLYWGLWGVNQAATEGCEEFDYLLYAHNRFQQYFAVKAEQYP
mmetsp:Transcript_15830/g.24643  ORF Transcript_15830/g.24643 Transcript_15830/m.24643 type:complete len:394 (+) Transcript_15830:138-1319(+)